MTAPTWDEVERAIGDLEDRIAALALKFPQLVEPRENLTLFASRMRAMDREQAEGVAFALLSVARPLVEILEKQK